MKLLEPPLDPTRVGLVLASDPDPNAEPQISNFKALCQGTAIDLRSGNYGTVQMVNIVLFQNNIGMSIGATNVNIVNLANRNYHNSGIVFTNKAAADTAKIINGTFYSRDGATSDINAGTGDPLLIGCHYVNGLLNVVNEVRTTVEPVFELVTVPNGKKNVLVTGTGNIGNINPQYDNYEVNLEFVSAGSQLLGGNFRLASAFTATAGGNITLRYNRATSKWVEVCRAN